MIKKLFVLLAGLFIVAGVSAQSAADVKKIEKSKEYFQKGKYDKAVSTIAKVQANPSYNYDNDIWNLRVIYEYYRYKTQLNKEMYDLARKAQSSKTHTVTMSNFKFIEYMNQMIHQCKWATVACEKQSIAATILFDELVAEKVDTAVSDDAKKAYREGDSEYNQENYSASIKQYQKALREDSTYYSATLSIGMAYIKMEEWEKAIPWYIKAKKMQPQLLKPHLDLVECYKKLKRWDDAYEACIDGIICYPTQEFFESMTEICEKKGKTFNRHWMSRNILPNRMNTDQDQPQSETWQFYRSAKNKIADNCDDKGIITSSTEITNQKYMEVYSWEYMMKKDDTDEKEFGFARRMEKEGFLDCYVFVSMYHINFREQYTDFSKNNADRIRTYINNHLVK